jgi:hypothetical protein
MDMDERQDEDERELARRLEAYADARLRPDPAAMARIRAAVVADARRGTGPVPLRRRPAFRFGLALLAAAALLAAIAGSASASQAGGPLYGARLWVETLTLPTAPSARAEAQIVRLDARLQELQTALAARDGAAAAAALDAYRSILGDTLATAPQDGALDQRLEATISQHVAVLQGLLATAPPQALPGLQNAIDRSDNGLQQLERRGTQGQPGQQTTPPGHQTTPPGQQTTPPGQQKTPPGQQKSPAATTPPGQASTPPGQLKTPPGQATTPPGQQGTAPSDVTMPKPSPSPTP